MEERKTIEIIFSDDETRFHALLLRNCSDKNITPSDYIKELVKRDLGWGQFMKRKKTGSGKSQ